MINKYAYPLGASGGSGGTTPEGTIELTTNGLHDVTDYAQANVNVQSEGNTLKKLLDAKQSSAHLFYSYQKKNTVDDLISYNDTENVLDMTSMFERTNIRAFPNLNMTNVSTIYKMFDSDYSLSGDIEINNEVLAVLDYAFRSTNISKAKINTQSATSLYYTFWDCVSLKDVELTSLMNVISGIKLNYMLKGCIALERLIFQDLKQNFQIGSGTEWGHLLTNESLINACKECINANASKTLTVGSANLNKLASVYVRLTNEPEVDSANPKLPCEVCEATDEGAMLISDYMTLKNWSLA